MTQHCKHDEQLLDFVYGELSDAERKAFADHLPGCRACSTQVEGFGLVRKEFQQRPPIEPVGESMQRMTALLMAAAAASTGAKGGEAATDGGKVLAFRSRGLRRILFHPAGGVMAVAAAALFWVVFRAQPVTQPGLPAPSSPTAFEPARGPAAAPSPAAVATATTMETAKPVIEPVAKNLSAEPADPAASAARVAAGDSKPELKDSRSGLVADVSHDGAGRKGDALSRSDDFDGLRDKTPADKKVTSLGYLPSTEKQLAAPSKPQMVAQLEQPTAFSSTRASGAKPEPSGNTVREGGAFAAGKGSAPFRAGETQYRQGNSGPAVVAMADQAYAKAEKKEAERPPDRWSQPPAAEPPAPPPAQAAPQPAPSPAADEEDNSVGRAIARTQEQRKQKVVDELANQQLANLGSAAGAPVAPPPQASEGRYAQRSAGNTGNTGNSLNNRADTGSNSYGNRAGQGDVDDAPTAVATPATPTGNMQGRGQNIVGIPDDGAAALSAIKEQLRRGQCAEANTALAKLERSLPATRGLAETRAEWQSTCAAATQRNLDRRMMNESSESLASPSAAYPAMKKSRMASPAPMPAKAPSRAKAAKPIDRGAAKAADL